MFKSSRKHNLASSLHYFSFLRDARKEHVPFSRRSEKNKERLIAGHRKHGYCMNFITWKQQSASSLVYNIFLALPLSPTTTLMRLMWGLTHALPEVNTSPIHSFLDSNPMTCLKVEIFPSQWNWNSSYSRPEHEEIPRGSGCRVWPNFSNFSMLQCARI